MLDFKIGETCPVCEQGVLDEKIGCFSFVYKGHTFTKEVKKLCCNNCGESFLYSCDEQIIDKEAIDFRRNVDNLLTPDEIVSLRKRNHLTQMQFASILGIGAKNFCRYEQGKFAQPKGIDLILKSIDVLGSDYIKLLSGFTNTQYLFKDVSLENWVGISFDCQKFNYAPHIFWEDNLAPKKAESIDDRYQYAEAA